MAEVVDVDIYLKNGKVLRLKINDFDVKNFLKNMSADPGSAIVLDHCGFIACSEIAAVMRVDGKVDVS
jgi:sRNA-binding regulator protein Hfq